MNQDDFQAICTQLLENTQEPIATLRGLVVSAVGNRVVSVMRRTLIRQVNEYYQPLFDQEAGDVKQLGLVCADARGIGNMYVHICTVTGESKPGVRNG